MRTVIISSTLLALVACGGSSKSSGLGKGTTPPPPPDVSHRQDITAPTAPGKAEPKREISKDARSDYKAALDYFNGNDKGQWSESACKSAADKFSGVVKEHPELVEAQFMVGLSYQRCNLDSDAEKAYQAATHMKGDPAKIAMSLSNLGQLYYKAGKLDAAKSYWDSALKATGKLVGAHVNVATFELEQMRKINNPKDATWKKLEEDARFHLSSALGVDTDSVDAYTNYGLVWMEGWQQNKNRLDLAKTLLDEAKKRNEKYAPLQNAYGLFYMHKNSLNQALAAFQAAVDLDPKFVEARINAGQLTLGFRKYDVAKDMFSKALEVAPKNYDAMIGLGIAQRGLNDFEGAEASYKKARDIDPRQGDAYYNLAVLYKDFKAAKSSDLSASIGIYKQARDFFSQFQDKVGDAPDKAEAKEQIVLIDKTIKQIENFQKAQASMPQQPAAPAAPAAPAGGAAAGSGAGSAAPATPPKK